MPELRTSQEWADAYDIVVVDPDGWDRSSAASFERSWSEAITREEFERRLMRSTITPQGFS